MITRGYPLVMLLYKSTVFRHTQISYCWLMLIVYPLQSLIPYSSIFYRIVYNPYLFPRILGFIPKRILPHGKQTWPWKITATFQMSIIEPKGLHKLFITGEYWRVSLKLFIKSSRILNMVYVSKYILHHRLRMKSSMFLR